VRYKLPLLLSLALASTSAFNLAHAAKGAAPPSKSQPTTVAGDRDLRYPVPTDFEFAYIDKTGKVVITGPFAMAHSFSHGVAVVNEKPYEWHEGHWTAPMDSPCGLNEKIIDTQDKTVTKRTLDAIEPFKDEYTIAQERTGTAGPAFVLVDTHGKTSPIQKCQQATNFAEGLFAIKNDLESGAIDTIKMLSKAMESNRPESDPLLQAGPRMNGLPLGQERPDGFGYMDKTGKLVIPCRYALAGPFSEGLAAVGLTPMGLEQLASMMTLKPGQKPHMNAYYYVDKAGAKVIKGPFQEAAEFRGGLAAICLGDQWGFIDKTGQQVVPCQYDWVGEFSGRLAPAEKNNLVGFIDKSGKVAIPFKFKNAESFGEGLAPATADGAHWGFIDTSGNFKIEPTFQRTHPFSDGLALVYIKPRTDIGTHPEEAEYFYKTANKLREDGFLNDAVRYCDAVIKMAPESEWAKRATKLKLVALPDHVIPENLISLLQVGTFHAERRDFDPAAKIFRECLEQDPGYIQASGSLAYVLISQKKYDEALTVLTDTLAKFPNYARGYFRLAQVYEGQGKIAEAQTTLAKAQSLAPEDLLIQVYDLTPGSK
jgi:hypothetical protein